MKNKSKRLKPVVRIAETREEKAALAMGESQQALQQQQSRLEELKRYRQEYIANFHADGRAGISAQRMLQLQSFLERLNRAIDEQQHWVEVACQHLEKKTHAWQAARSHAKALDKVVDRHQRSEQRQQSRREQKETDEVAQRRHGSRSHFDE